MPNVMSRKTPLTSQPPSNSFMASWQELVNAGVTRLKTWLILRCWVIFNEKINHLVLQQPFNDFSADRKKQNCSIVLYWLFVLWTTLSFSDIKEKSLDLNKLWRWDVKVCKLNLRNGLAYECLYHNRELCWDLGLVLFSQNHCQ